ncbi:DUF995 domain-containing protein [Arsenicitalea aurantiaca]|uniref:DUF995 domain-containing protein n=1 Tax=Arsenicitalea aurantiaca TaxID=1783274 RepID=A0A433XL85_9HYPH|nr:DUF995 domain-containing protein [Arsenicitalea aurantiaca]RUT34821.1 DUF995 domain-containing protein [Arsenicitalea aurantiaca]
MTNTTLRRIAAGLATGLALAISALPAQSATLAEAVAKAKPMNAGELYELYAGKTWRWGDGGAYFAADRTFTAIATEDGTPSIAEGRWRITDTGRMCLEATWRFKGGASPAVTCFQHRSGGRAVFQLAEPGGNWSVMMDGRPSQYPPLVRGDEISQRLNALRAELARR